MSWHSNGGFGGSSALRIFAQSKKLTVIDFLVLGRTAMELKMQAMSMNDNWEDLPSDGNK